MKPSRMLRRLVRSWGLEVGGLFALLLCTYLVPQAAGLKVWGDPFTGNSGAVTALRLSVDSGTFAQDDRQIRAFIVRTLTTQHRLPEWLPTQGLGAPLIEQYEYQVFNPLEWLNWLGGEWWWTIVFCLEMTAAGIGLMLFARSALNCSRVSAFGGAVVYTLLGFAALFYAETAFITEMVPLPYVLYFLWRLCHGADWRRGGLGLSLSIALLLVCGQPQIAISAALILGLAIVIEAAQSIRSLAALKRFVVVGAASCAAGVLIAAPQIFPALAAQLSGTLWSIHSPEIAGVNIWRTAPVNIFNPIAPFLGGVINPWFISPMVKGGLTDDFAISFGAVGFWLILVATVAAFRARFTTGRSLVVTLIGTLALIASMALIPGFGFPLRSVNFNRYSPPTLGLLGSCLIAYGIQHLDAAGRAWRWLCAGFVAAVPVVGALYLVHNVAPTEIVSRSLLDQSIMLTAAPVLGLVVLLGVVRRSTNWPAAAVVLLAAEATFAHRYGLALPLDAYRLVPFGILVLSAVFLGLGRWRTGLALAGGASLLFISGWVALSPQLARVTKNVLTGPATAMLRTQAGSRPRVLAAGDVLSPDTNTALNIDSLAGRHPIESKATEGYLYQFLRPSVLSSSQRNISMIMLQGVDGSPASAIPGRQPDSAFSWTEYVRRRLYFNLLGVDLLADARDGPLSKVLAGTPDAVQGIKRIYRDDVCEPGACVDIYRDGRALPRAYFSTAYDAVPMTLDAWAARQWLASAGDGILKKPVIELAYGRMPTFDGISKPPTPPPARLGIDRVEVVSFAPGDVRLRAQNATAGLVVLNDAFNTHWKAFVNGTQTSVLRVNSVMLGTLVGPGPVNIRFVYQGKPGRNVLISLLAMIAALAAAVLPAHSSGSDTRPASVI